jgi:hypothetical protein
MAAGPEDAPGVTGPQKAGEEVPVSLTVRFAYAVEALIVRDQWKNGVVVLCADGFDDKILAQTSAFTLVIRSARLAGITS